MVVNYNPHKRKKEPLMEHRMMDARFYQAQGKTQNEIAEIFGVTDRTVRNYLSERPRERKKPVRPSRLDPFGLHREKVSPEGIYHEGPPGY